jgi:hypothetical protein
MAVIDEYLAVRVLRGERWPEGLPDTEDVVVPTGRHWRLLRALHAPGNGQLSRILSPLSPAAVDALRFTGHT